MDPSNKFVTAINCIDGRVQEPVTEYLKKIFHADFVDTITHPGTDKFFIEQNRNQIKELKEEVSVSVNAHKSHIVAISGHHECAANPVSREKHIEEIAKAVETILSWGLNLSEVIGLYVNENWEVEKVI
jgi:hypothetical protein